MSVKGPASLTSALIVTKGNAAPAGLVAFNGKPAAKRRDVPVSAVKPVPAPGGHGETGSAGAAGAAGAAGSSGHGQSAVRRARLTLRLDPCRHLRIRLAAAHLNRSLQEIMIDALDRHLTEIHPTIVDGDCSCLAGPLPGPAGARESSGG
jgi:hypothetical protein